MKVTPTTIPEVLLITPARHGDERGWFSETFRQSALAIDWMTPAEEISTNERGGNAPYWPTWTPPSSIPSRASCGKWEPIFRKTTRNQRAIASRSRGPAQCRTPSGGLNPAAGFEVFSVGAASKQTFLS
jgi:hypothetical protein